MNGLDNTLYIIVPCYNEEEVLRETAMKLRGKMKELMREKKISEAGKIVFVDDGSRDATWSIIRSLCDEDSIFAGIGLSRNRGHQNALYAGLMTVKDEADMVISIDADLQDDKDAIDRMVDEFLSGCDIVYGVRKSRDKDSFFKRFTAERYYTILRRLGCDIVFNHADYRLMSAEALGALSEYGEQRLFLRGLVPLLGYKTAVVEYERGERTAGVSKYPLKRMLTLAFDGVASLSLRPLRMVAATGALMLLAALAILVWMFVAFCMGRIVPDRRIIVFSIWAVGGLVMLGLGVVGEYVGRAFMETKKRPRYNISRTAGELYRK